MRWGAPQAHHEPSPSAPRMVRLSHTGESAGSAKRPSTWQAALKAAAELAGLVELSLEIPATMPHFVRLARFAGKTKLESQS